MKTNHLRRVFCVLTILLTTCTAAVSAELEGILVKTHSYELVTKPGEPGGVYVKGARPDVDAILRHSAYIGEDMSKILLAEDPDFLQSARRVWVSGEMDAQSGVFIAQQAIDRAQPNLDGKSLAMCYRFMQKLGANMLSNRMHYKASGWAPSVVLFYRNILADALKTAKAVVDSGGSFETAKEKFLAACNKLSTRNRGHLLRSLRNCPDFDEALKLALDPNAPLESAR
jgi:hypothetical protein